MTSRMARWMRYAITAMAAVVVASAPFVWADTLKVGYVNVGRLFDSYQRTKDAEQVLQQKGKQKRTELEGRFNELKKMRQGLELLNDQAREAKAREIEERSDAFQQIKTKSERELLRERNQVAQQILGEVQQVVSDYAKANGFTVILDQRSLLFGQDAYDVTDEILRNLNEQYASRGNKAASTTKAP